MNKPRKIRYPRRGFRLIDLSSFHIVAPTKGGKRLRKRERQQRAARQPNGWQHG